MKKPARDHSVLDFLDSESSYSSIPYDDVDRLYSSFLFCARVSMSPCNEVPMMDAQGTMTLACSILSSPPHPVNFPVSLAAN